jgi:hypothetical protein
MLTEQVKLQHDMDSLKEGIRLGWVDMASKPMRPKDRQELRKHIVALGAELTRLLAMLD